MDKHIQNPMEREPKECTHTHTHTDDLCIPVWPYGLAGTSYPPQRKCPFTVHSSVVCHHILSPSFKRQYEACSAQPSHSFEVKSSRKETVRHTVQSALAWDLVGRTQPQTTKQHKGRFTFCSSYVWRWFTFQPALLVVCLTPTCPWVECD